MIIGVDRSGHELRLNPDLALKVVADAAADEFPFRDESLDLIVSRSVVEHLRNNEVFFASCARVLRPGGALIHTFPCKFAPFSLINQFLPNALARRLLAYLHPQWKEECGFPAFYDRCYFSAVQQLLERNGFRDPRFEFRYYQSIYFDFFLPLYALMLLYDLTCWMMGVRNLACGILVTAEQPAGNPGDVAKVPDVGESSRGDASDVELPPRIGSSVLTSERQVKQCGRRFSEPAGQSPRSTGVGIDL
jgi:SAM-dependent methyltransferase